ncbi:MAG: DUF5362 family protein [Fuerstiella sp.]
MSDNPFAVGNYGSSGGISRDPSQDPILGKLIEVLLQTRPWVRLIGILVMIAAAFMVLIGIALLAGFGGQQAALKGPIGPAVGVIYMAMSILYLYPGLKLFRYASAISQADSTGQMHDIVEAMIQQKKFWKFCGVFAAIMLVFYILGLVVMTLG